MKEVYLRCDYCGKPIIETGENFEHVEFTVAWKESGIPISGKFDACLACHRKRFLAITQALTDKEQLDE